MDRKDLKIVIVDDSKTSISYISLLLKKMNLENIEYFTDPYKFINYLKKNRVDIIIIDYCMPKVDGLTLLGQIRKIDKDVITIMMTNITDNDVKLKAIECGVNDFIPKHIDFPEFMAKMNVLINLRLYYYKVKSYEEDVKEILKYKDKQERMTVVKQYKIIEDYVSHHYYENWLADSYFKPLDIVSGDSYTALKVNEHKFFISIVDGMGKGISASLTSVLTIAFINHAISKSKELHDFDFSRVIEDTFNYVKSILLEYEALSFALALIDIKNETIEYANFGLPPFYLKRDKEVIKLKPNNQPLLITTKNFVIDRYEKFDSFLMASDGLTECLMENGYPFFTIFKEVYSNSCLLNELISDFSKRVKRPEDDVTVFLFTKDNCKYNTLYYKTFKVSKVNIEDIISNIEKKLNLELNLLSGVIFVIQELLLNIFEHSFLKMGKNKQKIVKKGIKIKYNDKEESASIKIKESKKFILIELEDNGEGFEINNVLKREWFDRYHGRGIKMILKLVDGIYYNSKGNKVKVYIKKEQKWK